MTKNSFLSFVLLSSTFLCPYAASADVVEVSNWNQLKGYATTYGNTYIINSNITPGPRVYVGKQNGDINGGKVNEGSWNLKGDNKELNGGWGNNGFSIEDNITDFVFENLNMKNFQDKNGSGVIWNSGGSTNSKVQNSTFRENGGKTGGVIRNDGTLSLINNTFENNFTDNGQGGAVFNSENATIVDITGNTFKNNSIYGSEKFGGAICEKFGGAIYNTGTISNIKNNIFENNGFRVGEDREVGDGAAIYNDQSGSIGTIDSTFTGNQVTDLGGAIYNKGAIDSVAGAFTSNNAQNNGGAIYNANTIKTVDGTFENNGSTNGGAIFNAAGATIEEVKGTYTNNGTAKGGAIYNEGTIGTETTGISADFASNYSSDDGGAIYNKEGAIITSIKDSKFNKNNTEGKNGGAVYNNGTINSITNSQFTNNGYVTNGDGGDGGRYASVGGAVYNGSDGVIGTINSTFTGNKSGFGGSAIFNDGEIKTISGTFSDNYSGNEGGGAIRNKKTIGTITNATFENNIADLDLGKGGAVINGIDGRDNPADNTGISIDTISDSAFYGNHSNDFGGALNNFATINTISNVTFGAEGKGNQGASGGALNNQWGGRIGSISGSTFSYNQALETTDFAQGRGGAIRNFGNSSIGTIVSSTFKNNVAGGLKEEFRDDNTHIFGGALYNAGSVIQKLESLVFENNMSGIEKEYIPERNSVYAYGGALFNGKDFNKDTAQWVGDNATITDGIADSSFENNSVIGSTALGGAIYNAGIMGSIVNTSFKNNFASARDEALGGAVYSTTGLDIQAQNGESIFAGNYVQVGSGDQVSNSIYMAGADENSPLNLNLTSKGDKGLIRFDDGIDGKSYNIALDGDTKGVVRFNSTVNNAQALTLTQNAHMQMGLGADINVGSMSLAPSVDKQAKPLITVDIEVDKANNKVNSGKINVAGDLEGHYDVIVNSLNPDVLDNPDDAIVPFLYALKDDTATDSSFSVARVIGSPYLWDGMINAKGEEEGSTWYLGMTDQDNPDFEKPVEPVDPDNPSGGDDNKPDENREVYAEVVGALGLHEAAIEQTRSMVRHVSQQTALSKEYCRNCGVYGYNYNGKELKNVWADVIGEYANIDKPVDMDADIWGVEAGFDLQRDVHNTLGVFASYRKGNYDLSGKADRLSSKVGSEIDIDSYLAGLYYRYDKNMNWVFATVYGGIQKADVKADDGFAKFDTDGIEFGAAVEIGRTIPLAQSWTLNPSIGLSYTQINYDNAHDNVGKSYKWDDVKFVEAEIGARLDKQFDQGKIYVKPSLIQTFTDGDEVQISGMNHKYDTYKDQTLGRIEVGGRYGFNDNWSGYAWANYTFGSSYDATAGGLGISYSW